MKNAATELFSSHFHSCAVGDILQIEATGKKIKVIYITPFKVYVKPLRWSEALFFNLKCIYRRIYEKF